MKKGTILIVEDEAIVAEDLETKLQRLGYEVVGVASKVDEAVEAALRLHPQLVLMDIQLEAPRDGIEAAERIRNSYDVPVVYLTAHSDPATLGRAKLSGPFGYILKPFDQRDLATQLELALYKHQADRKVREQREWLHVTLNSIGEGVIATDVSGRITLINPVAEALTGWSMEEAEGKFVEEVFRIENEIPLEPVENRVQMVIRTGNPVGLSDHTMLIRKDGSKIPVADSGAPIRDEKGKVLGVVLVFRDISRQRKAEQTLRAAHLELAAKNLQVSAAYSELYEYSEAISQDLGGVMRAVTNYSDFLYEDLSRWLTGEQRFCLENLKRVAKGGRMFIQELRSLAKIGKYVEVPEYIDFSKILEEIIGLYGSDPSVKFILPKTWPDVQAQPSLLQIILGNLIDNAIKFNRAEKKRIEVGWRDFSPGRVELFVCDNGIGIDPQFHERVFRIFKRLDSDEEKGGTGMGLALVRKAARQLGGSVRVESEKGKGSTFIVNLPV